LKRQTGRAIYGAERYDRLVTIKKKARSARDAYKHVLPVAQVDQLCFLNAFGDF
jgi:hypothetical protein